MKYLMLLSSLALAGLAQAADDTERRFNATHDAADIQTVELEANVGQVRMETTDEDKVIVEVTVTPDDDDDWFGHSERVLERIRKAELKHELRGSTLVLSLDYPRNRNGDDDIEEEWLIRMPARMAADVNLNVGELEIRGLAGGVSAEVNVGELDINVERGDVSAEVNVGELSIVSRTDSPGEFDLSVNVGDARLRINGESIEPERGWIGGSLEHDAGGEDDISAETNVGDVRVEVIR